MRITHRRTRDFLFVLALILFAAPAARADNFSFTGTLTLDDEVRFFGFAVGAASPVTLRTWSYSGGTNAAGAVIPGGGFDTVLSLFTSGGLLINSNDDQVGGNRDALLSVFLQPGSYILALTQYDNFARGPFLTNGFLRAGEPAFTREFAAPGAAGFFYDVTGDRRTGAFALDILNVQTAAPIPEPATLLLLGAGLVGAAARARRRNRREAEAVKRRA